MLLCAPVLLALPSPEAAGCATFGCSGHRSFDAIFRLPTESPTVLWTDTHFHGVLTSCSGDGQLAACATSDGRTAGFDARGLVWQASQKDKQVKSHTKAQMNSTTWPPVLAGSGETGIVAALEGPSGTRRAVVRSRTLGGLAYSALVEVGAGVGAYLMPRGGIDDALLLALGDVRGPPHPDHRGCPAARR
jgi:hypothetical protein